MFDLVPDGLLYAEIQVAPMCRKPGGSYMAREDTRKVLAQSNQRSQYTIECYQSLLSEFGITYSMCHRGDIWDNSAMESLFSSLKTERTSRLWYRTRN